MLVSPGVLFCLASLQYAIGLRSHWAKVPPVVALSPSLKAAPTKSQALGRRDAVDMLIERRQSKLQGSSNQRPRRASFGRDQKQESLTRARTRAEVRSKAREANKRVNGLASASSQSGIGAIAERFSALASDANEFFANMRVSQLPESSVKMRRRNARDRPRGRAAKAQRRGLRHDSSQSAIEVIKVKSGALLSRGKQILEKVKPLQIFAGVLLGAFFLRGPDLGGAGDIILIGRADDRVMQRTVEFGEILENIRSSYVDDVDIDVLFGNGANSMLQTLDPYSNVASTEDFNTLIGTQFGGLGIGIAKIDEKVIVTNAYEGYGYDAGVRVGDQLLKVDDKDVDKSMQIKDIVKLLRGEPGTSVILTIQRDGSPEPELLVPVLRKNVNVPSVPFAAFGKDDKIGYIKIATFSANTGAETRGAISALQAIPDLKALVIDMRDNPGGLLTAAVEVAGLIVPEGTDIVSTSGAGLGKQTNTFRSESPPVLSPDVRVAILVNGATASAAEIVTGAIQDMDRGIVVGTRTFGKGLVQSVSPLSIGGDALTITAGRYYTPSGRCIQERSYTGGRLANKDSEQRVDVIGKPEFRTKSGRMVKANGGITPDVVMEEERLGELEQSLYRRSIFTEFVSEWLRKHPAPEKKMIDSILNNRKGIYTDFVFYAREKLLAVAPDTNSQAGESRSQKKLDELEEAIGSSSSSSNLAKRQVVALRQVLSNEMLGEFRSKKDVLEQDVIDAMLQRLIPPSASFASLIERDPQVQEAKRLASDPVLYAKLLEPSSEVSTEASTELPTMSVSLFPPVGPN